MSEKLNVVPYDANYQKLASSFESGNTYLDKFLREPLSLEDWFGKSNKFAKSHIADSDEIYRNYAPEMENISNVINLLDAKYGTGRGINRLISYITTDNINEITKENGIRNIIKTKLSNKAIITFIIISKDS